MSGQGDQLTIDPTTFYAHLNHTVAELNFLDENLGSGTNLNMGESVGQNDPFILAYHVLKLAYIRRYTSFAALVVTN